MLKKIWGLVSSQNEKTKRIRGFIQLSTEHSR